MIAVLVLQFLASAALAVAFVGIWTQNRFLIWGGWLAYFPCAESLGFIIGGTFSSVVWYLRAQSNWTALLGSLICGLFVWAGTWHFVIQRDLGATGVSWIDGAVFGFAFLSSFISARFARQKQKPQ